MDEKQALPRLSNNTRNYLSKNAFDNDKLERKKLAEKLTGYLNRLNDGAVLALDAPWGEGKTWFGKNWNKFLEEQGYQTVYIDAFEQDYMEDPFMLLTSEILNIEENSNPKFEDLKKSGVEVAKALLPIGAKALLNFGGRVLLGSSDISEEVKDAISAGKDVTSQLTTEWLNNKLDNYITDKATMDNFKEQLKKYAMEQSYPIVIFIDELDRCKPTFAVNLIERIKHFFDVPNVVFVLLLNREQLENAVKGIYGNDTDAHKYLDKFINFYFKFPRIGDNEHLKDKQLDDFISLTMLKYNFKKDRENDNFISWLKFWSVCFDLSLRDIEKCVALYAFAYPVNLSYILVYFIVFKVKRKDLYEKLVNNNKEAHAEAKKLISNFIQRVKTEKMINERTLKSFYEWHDAHCSDFKTIGDNFKGMIENISLWHIENNNLFRHFSNMIDLDIER